MSPKNNRKRRWVMLLAIAILLVTLSGLALPAMAQSGPTTIASDDLFAQIYDRVSPSVVAILVTVNPTASANPGQPAPQNPGFAEGTGIVLDTEGHILTNNHVVANATSIQISFIDGTLAGAEVVGADPGADLAVLKVDLPAEQLSQLQPAEFGDSGNLRIGQTVLAIGSPFGQEWTLTSGIISALNRTIQGLTNYSIGGVIQTDAAINPGNSGGPLLDLDGRVIGINSQIASESRSNAGIGFAIPGNLALRVAQALIDQGFVQYSYLGIRGGDMSLALIEAFDLPHNTRGVVVGEVVAGGPAARAGLSNPVFPAGSQPNDPLRVPTAVDIITAIDGQPLLGMADLITYLATNTEPGQTVTLTVLRNGSETIELSAGLTPRPS